LSSAQNLIVADFEPLPCAAGYQLSNPSILATAALLGSLSVFEKTTMAKLRQKSLLLTGYLEHLLNSSAQQMPGAFRIITPSDPDQRGCQLSLLFSTDVKSTFVALENRGIVCDLREPDCIRVAPVPLYNTFVDVYRFWLALDECIKHCP
jgi:kynureninase